MPTNINFEAWTSGPSGQTGKVTAIVSLADVLVDQPPLISLPAWQVTAASVANPTELTTRGAHGMATGDHVVLQGSNSTPTVDGDRAIIVTGSTTFTVPVNVTVAGTKANIIRRTATVTADKQRVIMMDAAAGASAGIPAGQYENVTPTGGTNLFRLTGVSRG